MGREQTYGGQGDRAISEQPENERKSSRRSRRLDSGIRRVFGELQRLRAIHEERRIALGQIELSGIHFSKKSNQLSDRNTFLGGGRIQVSEELSSVKRSQDLVFMIPL